MRMIHLFAEDVYLGMNILLRMDAHSYSAGNNILYKLVHSILDLFIVSRLLYITLNIIEELFLRLFCIRVKKQTLLICSISEFVHIDTNQNANLGSLLYKLSNTEISRCSEISDKSIKEMHFFIFEYSFYFFKKSIFFFIREKVCSHIYCFVITISSLVSTSNTFAIFTSISNDGCILLEHHLETVEGSLPSCSASHLPVFFCSTNTTFSLFKSFIIYTFYWRIPQI